MAHANKRGVHSITWRTTQTSSVQASSCSNFFCTYNELDAFNPQAPNDVAYGRVLPAVVR